MIKDPDKEYIFPILSTKQKIEEVNRIVGQLNEGQLNAYNTIVNTKDKTIFFITGSPGVGKTFLARAILLHFELSRMRIRAIAPSHKAKNVLQNALQSSATTVARFCGYTMEDTDNPIVNDEGDFVKTRETENVDVSIVDEVSMVSDVNFEEIVDSSNCMIIAMGDKNQLEAINTDSANLSDAVVLELTEQMRQDNLDTALYKNIQMLKRKIQGSNEPLNFEFDETFIKSENLMDEYINNNIEIIVVFRNLFVDAYNKAIQESKRGTAKPAIGDTLLLNKPMYTIRGVKVVDKITYPILKNNGDTITILNIHKTQPSIGMIVDIDEEGKDKTRLLLSREQWATKSFIWNLWLSIWKPIMPWKEFKRFTLNTSLPFAVTTHKVQGSTYDSVGVNLADMSSAWKLNDQYRMMYVALSRAKNKCYVKMP